MTSKIFSTLGFLFSPDFSQVLLIEKIKPTAHAGLLNGLGGKFEKGETAKECIVREVEEETGLVTAQQNWIVIGDLIMTGWHVEVFTSVYESEIPTLQNSGDEKIGWYPVDNLPDNVITNLTWLIPMCVDKLKNKHEFIVDIHYS